MGTKKMLEQFEAAFVAQYGFGRMAAASNPDANAIYCAAEWAWQSSRDAVVIELPCGYDPYRANGDPDMLNVNDTLQECREAIEAQGFKVAP